MAVNNNGVETIFGAATIAKLEANTGDVFKTLKTCGISKIDTAYRYEGSEETLGNADAASDFSVDTKAIPGSGTKESIFESIQRSLRLLKTNQVDTYYLHTPDIAGTPFSETLWAINELYKAGQFKRFGLSNFSVSQVQQVYDIATENGYIRPSVYQGNYNAFSRINETDLIPLLRNLNISFRVYSPIAGGFLTKSAQQVKNNALTGRWDPNTPSGQVYGSIYKKPKMIQGLEEWERLSQEYGIPKGAMAYRFIKYHSALQPGDAIIFGVSKFEHIEQTCQWLNEGPLPNQVVQGIENIWLNIRDVSSRDPVESFRNMQKAKE